MSDINNILVYAAALYQVKEPKVNSIEAKTLMATMHTHLVRLINLIESSTEKLPIDGLSNFYNLDSLPGGICESKLPDNETHYDVPIPWPIQRKTGWESQCNAPGFKTTHKAKSKQGSYSGRLF